ncbi:MAG: ABC transporter substrate-binding protein [Bradyrhizobium sp.]|uniref:ABC transporter substrate-binding protein n=1 Tax=Bradyrhizobium sp. TaxID=376 RepID=UPI003C7877AF
MKAARKILRLALVLIATALVTGVAQAEVSKVRISRQYGLPYLPMIVIEDQHLLEKNAKAAGIEVETEWSQRAGPAADLDALLAGQADFIGPGIPTLATVWDKTVGTAQEARALIAMQSMPYVLVTRNPAVKTIADFTEKDKIALPAVKLTGHAIALETEAARIWGQDHYDKLDSITITRSHADAAAALITGKSEINSHFASAPFYHYELATPGIHQVLKSYDTLGGMHTNGVLLTTRKFHDANPKLCAAMVASFEEADAFIKAHPREAAQTYLKVVRDKTSLDDLEKMVADPDVEYTTTPVNVMKIVDFMHEVGRIKKKPASWKDLFFPEAHGLNGS